MLCLIKCGKIRCVLIRFVSLVGSDDVVVVVVTSDSSTSVAIDKSISSGSMEYFVGEGMHLSVLCFLPVPSQFAQ